jgi:tetratricopeptide (TPR) repeat protein
MFGILRAQIGHAKVALARGNTPYAERVLDETIAAAAQNSALVEVHAVALQDRADVAFHRARYDLAVELAYRSLEITRDPVNRDRLLSGIASAFYMLGVRSAACDAWLILEATAQEQFSRWQASINLMEVAAREGSMTRFERYRRSLGAIKFPASIAAQFQLQTAESYEALAQFDEATRAAQRARVIAEQHGFNRTAFAAEAVIARMKQGKPTAPVQQEQRVPESLQEIATTLSQLRTLVPSGAAEGTSTSPIRSCRGCRSGQWSPWWRRTEAHRPWATTPERSERRTRTQSRRQS